MTVPPPAEIRRIAYLGTPTTATAPLRAIHDAGYEIPLVITRPDTRRRRGAAFQASPVKAAALSLGLRVSDDLKDLTAVDADLGVVVAYGEIIPSYILEELALVNLHFSLLPRWRGAAPLQRAILAGDEVTGVSLMAVTEGLDTGPIYRSVATPIAKDEISSELYARLVRLGSDLLIETLAEGLGQPKPQQGEPTYATKITSEDCRINWSNTASYIHRQVRVGGAWTTFRNERFQICRSALPDACVAERTAAGKPGSINGLTVATGKGQIELLEVQAPGRARQAAFSWRNGARLTINDRFV